MSTVTLGNWSITWWWSTTIALWSVANAILWWRCIARIGLSNLNISFILIGLTCSNNDNANEDSHNQNSKDGSTYTERLWSDVNSLVVLVAIVIVVPISISRYNINMCSVITVRTGMVYMMYWTARSIYRSITMITSTKSTTSSQLSCIFSTKIRFKIGSCYLFFLYSYQSLWIAILWLID